METNQEQPNEAVQPDQIAGYHDDIRQIEIEGYELGVKKARNALFWSAALIGIWETIGLIRAGQEPDITSSAIMAVIIGAFIALGFWTKKKPYTAIIAGLVLFICYLLLGVWAFGYLEGAEGVIKALFSGIVVKVAILVSLIRPLKDARELQKLKDEEKIIQ